MQRHEIDAGNHDLAHPQNKTNQKHDLAGGQQPIQQWDAKRRDVGSTKPIWFAKKKGFCGRVANLAELRRGVEQARCLPLQLNVKIQKENQDSNGAFT